MRASNLTIEQARKLKDQIAERLRYLNRLVDRMTKLGFVPTDDLYAAALRAQAGMHELHVKAHYAGCKHGVAKIEEGGWPDKIIRRA